MSQYFDHDQRMFDIASGQGAPHRPGSVAA